MRRIIPFSFVLLCVFLVSCRKEENSGIENSFIRLVSADSQMAALACFVTPDNQYLLFGRNYKFRTPGDIWGIYSTDQGMIAKLSRTGDELWRRPIPVENSVVWKALRLRHGGYITVGYKDPASLNFTIIRYDDQVNVVSMDSLPMMTAWGNTYAHNFAPMEVLELRNGNFVFISSLGTSATFMLTDPDFHLLHSEFYYDAITGENINTFHGLTQINDSTLGITGFSNLVLWTSHEVSNTYLITTDLNGVMKTLAVLVDSVFSETPNYLGNSNGGVFHVSSTMNGRDATDGTWVDYYNNINAAKVAGRINLVRYDSTGNFLGRKKVYGYPGFGMISTGKPTRDGGHILCGTVNQSMHNTIDNRTQIFLLRLDENGDPRWSKVINTTYASFAMDVCETADGGFLIAGHQFSNNNRFNLIAIKTDVNGNY